jgi:protein-S-isoprenylcysteine O-methyltransferase Ste14
VNIAHVGVWDWALAPWIVFGLVWLVTGLRTKRTVERQLLSQTVPYTVLVAVGIWLVLVPAFGFFIPVLGERVRPASDVVDVIGIAISAVGVGFAIWARMVIGRNWSGVITLKEDHNLVTTGPYAFVRHPIYTGIVVAMAGSALVSGTAGAPLGFVSFTAGFVLKLRIEEKLMREHFGDAHAAWCAQTKKLIPFVW